MSEDERPSPRAAICNWLIQTDNRARPASRSAPEHKRRRHQGSVHRDRRSRRSPNDHTTPANGAVGQEVRAHDKERGPRNAHSDARPTSSRPPQWEEVNPHRLDDVGLATRLDLQAPFRAFGRQNKTISQSQRPRRSPTSDTSYLEPAAIDNSTGTPSVNQYLTEERTSLRDLKKPASTSHHYLTASKSSSAHSASRSKPARLYERRARHKTRENLYEPGSEKRRRRKQKPADDEDKQRKPKKRRRVEKSGNALMHDFAAENVSRDRLTLKPREALGLFGRGRASSPVKRRGLPDLAFSELTFLNSRRAKPELVSKPSEKAKNRKTKKAADTEAEISRYFTTSHNPDYRTRVAQESRKSPHSHKINMAPSFIDLPDTPFLGFGSCGANSVSPARFVKEPDARRVLSRSQRDTQSPTRSTSYFTWSRSGAPSHASLISRHRGSVVRGLSTSEQYKYKMANDRETLPEATRSTYVMEHHSARPLEAFRTDRRSRDRVSSQSSHSRTGLVDEQGKAQALEYTHERLDRVKRPIGHQSTLKLRINRATSPIVTIGTDHQSHENDGPFSSKGNFPSERPFTRVESPPKARNLASTPHKRPMTQRSTSLDGTLDALLEDCKPLNSVRNTKSQQYTEKTHTEVGGCSGHHPRNDHLQVQRDSFPRYADPSTNLDEISHTQHVHEPILSLFHEDLDHPQSAPGAIMQPSANLRRPRVAYSEQYRPSSLPNAWTNPQTAWDGHDDLYGRQDDNDGPTLHQGEPFIEATENYVETFSMGADEEPTIGRLHDRQDMAYPADKDNDDISASYNYRDAYRNRVDYITVAEEDHVASEVQDYARAARTSPQDILVEGNGFMESADSVSDAIGAAEDQGFPGTYSNAPPTEIYNLRRPGSEPFQSRVPPPLSTPIARPPLRELNVQHSAMQMKGATRKAQAGEEGPMGFWTPHKLY